jgi:hypothetical protein
VCTQQLPAEAVDEQDDNAFGRFDGQYVALAGDTQRGQRGRQHVGQGGFPVADRAGG